MGKCQHPGCDEDATIKVTMRSNKLIGSWNICKPMRFCKRHGVELIDFLQAYVGRRKLNEDEL